MNDELQELRNAFRELRNTIVEEMFLPLFDFLFPESFKMDTNKILPWVLIGGLLLAAVYVLKDKTTPQQPTNPAVCPDCVPSPLNPWNCETLGRSVKADVRLLSTELVRTQAATNDLRRRQGLPPMRILDYWPGYGPDFGTIGNGLSSQGPATNQHDVEKVIKEFAGPSSSAPPPAGK